MDRGGPQGPGPTPSSGHAGLGASRRGAGAPGGAARGGHTDRRPARRAGLAGGGGGEPVHAAPASGGRARLRAHGSPSPHLRKRPLHRRAALRQRTLEDPRAAGPARRGEQLVRLRLSRGAPRSLPRPFDGRGVPGGPRRFGRRRDHRGEREPGSLVGSGLARARDDRLPGMDGRDGNSALPAPLQRVLRRDVGDSDPALDSTQAGAVRVLVHPAEGGIGREHVRASDRVGLAPRGASSRDGAVRPDALGVHAGHRRRPVPRRLRPVPRRGRGPQVRREQQHHAERHGESGFRRGGGGPGRREPIGL